MLWENIFLDNTSEMITTCHSVLGLKAVLLYFKQGLCEWASFPLGHTIYLFWSVCLVSENILHQWRRTLDQLLWKKAISWPQSFFFQVSTTNKWLRIFINMIFLSDFYRNKNSRLINGEGCNLEWGPQCCAGQEDGSRWEWRGGGSPPPVLWCSAVQLLLTKD